MTIRRLVTATWVVLLLLPTAVASAANTWAGVWNSDFGRLTMAADGSGNYEGFSPGTISGPASGSVNEGTWSQPGDPPREGTYKFTLSGDGKSFSGEWAYKTGGCGTACGWSGTCIEGACLKNGSAPAAPPAKGGFDVVAAPARWCAGGRSPGSMARIAQTAPTKCASTTGTLSPGDGAIATSPTIAAGQKEAVAVVVDDSGATFVNAVTAILTRLPSKKARFLHCIHLHHAISTTVRVDSNDRESLEFRESGTELAILALGVCLQIAADLNRQAAAEATRALVSARSCASARIKVPVRISKKRSRYSVRSGGKLKRARDKPVSVTCTRTDTSIMIRVRARKGSLRKAVGKRLRVGLYNEAKAAGAGRATVVFSRP